MIKEIEEEAERRLYEANQVGKKLIGSLNRDIIIICCYEQMCIGDVKKLSKKEFEELVKKWKKAKR